MLVGTRSVAHSLSALRSLASHHRLLRRRPLPRRWRRTTVTAMAMAANADDEEEEKGAGEGSCASQEERGSERRGR